MLTTLQEILVLALHDERPGDRLRALLQERAGALSPEEAAMLRGIDLDGLRLTSMIVRRLRFERALRGDGRLRVELAREPETLRADFRAYCAAVPARFAFPEEEARAFVEFRDARGGIIPG